MPFLRILANSGKLHGRGKKLITLPINCYGVMCVWGVCNKNDYKSICLVAICGPGSVPVLGACGPYV